ncbi:MAG: hypothetical protein M3Q36_04020 [bacterium]|nr:hypothetical protein [bacterium]
MNQFYILAIVIFGLILFVVVTLLSRRPPKELKREYFQKKWKDLQKQLAKPETWPMAIIQADNLLDEALRKRKFKGKTLGERLVSAQRTLTNNDGVWFGHKLRNKLVHETDTKISKKDVKDAMIGFGQALKDLGALKK